MGNAKEILSKVRVVLVEPQGPLNIGSVARVMKNMGLSHLQIVNPQCQVVCEESRLMAVHASDILESANVVSTLPIAIADCRRTAATTHRPSSTVPANKLEAPNHVLQWLLEEGPSAIVFGAEKRGLNNIELGFCQRYITLPVYHEYPVMNLAQAVTVCAYELHKLAAAESDAPEKMKVNQLEISGRHTATRLEYERMYEALQRMLWDVRFFRTERHNVVPYDRLTEKQKEWVMNRMFGFRALFDRAALSSQEVRSLRGLISSLQRNIKR